MADATTARVRMMLQGYEQQLLAARRLARFRVRRRLAGGESPEDPDPAARRHAFMEKVARELYEDIRQELGRELGQDVRFIYPPGVRLRILGQGPEGFRALTEEQQRATRNALWRITRRKVDENMLDKPGKNSD